MASLLLRVMTPETLKKQNINTQGKVSMGGILNVNSLIMFNGLLWKMKPHLLPLL